MSSQLRQAALSAVPYCGVPPGPGELAHRWNLDPWLIAALLAALAAYALASRRKHAPAWRRGCFAAGWAVTAAALVSPLCPLSVALFSARVSQHMLLTMLAAPLVALGWPRSDWRGSSGLPSGPLSAAAAFAAALWFWHMPALYAATFSSDTLYWAMHLSLFGSAVWFWIALFEGSGERLGASAAAIAFTSVQMGLLGAVLTFAGRPLFAPHLATAPLWGLTALQDQQLGGAIMWAPGGVIFAGGLVFALGQAMRRAEMRALARAA